MSMVARKCIVLSQGPVPTPEHIKVEGGGLRCWGLAQGIHVNNPALDITVAYHESYKQDVFTEDYEGIRIATWSLDDVAIAIESYDTIIVSYCMGGLSTKVVEAIRPDQQLILDCNVPIYVEASARNTNDVEAEYNAFCTDVQNWSHVLSRGDLFLCASEVQKEYYKGVLSAIGRINPVTYHSDMIKIVPYGIYRDAPKIGEKPITKMIGKANVNAKRVLWFGGIYPWFDLKVLIDAVVALNKTVPTKLIIVGAKNPFNTHPDFLRTYQELVDYVADDEQRKTSVYMQDWVEFDKRADWYLDSDIVVVANKIGEENRLSWRTRLVDFLWADLPIITNGGDPLGELLIAEGAAIRFHEFTAESIAEDLAIALTGNGKLEHLKANLSKLRKHFYWDIVTKSLAKAIITNERAPDVNYRTESSTLSTGSQSKIASVRSKVKKVPAYYRKYGVRTTAATIKTQLRNKFNAVTGQSKTRPSKIIVISHQLDLSGAPYVLIDIVSRMIKIPHIKERLDFRTFNPVARQNITLLNEMGVKPSIYLNKEVGFSFVPGDVVVLNSFAHSFTLLNSILEGVRSGRIAKLLWYGHEATPKGFVPEALLPAIKDGLRNDRIIIYATAEDCLTKYREFFNDQANILKMPYVFDLPASDFYVRKPKDFNTLSFVLPGTVGDGRKGQMPVLYAFIDFYERYYKLDTGKYRNFKLTYVGLDDGFLSQQIILNGNHGLNDHFNYYKKLSRSENLLLTKKANITICYSLQEALPLFVYEGMAYGHPIIRNESSGMVEQLREGKNGFKVSSADYAGLVVTIERVLNKDTTSNVQLANMSKVSTEIALEATKNHYFILDQLANL